MTANTNRRDPLVGLTLANKYRVVAPIARGGMGRVYRAIQQPLGREVALKVLDTDQIEDDEEMKDFERRFFLEAAACAKLQHPNTVVVYDYGRTEANDLFMVMELLNGRTLRREVKAHGALEPERAIHVALQVCGSIADAHAQGMVHRDLKPSNIMLSPRGSDDDFVKVLDFGLVKQDDAGLTNSGAMLGTPRYMSPEQIGNTNVGPHSDIYSLGAILHFMLTGKPPFDTESKFALLASHLHEPVPLISEAYPAVEISKDLELVVARCLEKKIEQRFASMGDLARALSFCPEHTGTASAHLPRPAAAFDDQSATRPVQSTGEEPTKVAKRSPGEPSLTMGTTGLGTLSEPGSSSRLWIAGLLAAVLGVGIVLFAWRVTRGDQSSAATADEMNADPLETGSETDESNRGETEADSESEELVEPEGADSEESAAAPGSESVPNVENQVDDEGNTPEAEVLTVRVTSSPSGARVMTADGRDFGDTPATIRVPVGAVIQMTRAGYVSREVSVFSDDTISVSLRRRRGASRDTSMNPEVTMDAPAETTQMETVMETATMEEATMNTSMDQGGGTMTDNRNPWAND